MNSSNRVVWGVVGAVVVIVALILLMPKNKGSQQPEKETFVVQQPGRKVDYGFAYKIDECLTSPKGDMFIVNIKDNTHYEYIDARRFILGPHPMTNDDVKEVLVADLDKDSTAKAVNCADLRKKYESEPQSAATPAR